MAGRFTRTSRDRGIPRRWAGRPIALLVLAVVCVLTAGCGSSEVKATHTAEDEAAAALSTLNVDGAVFGPESDVLKHLRSLKNAGLEPYELVASVDFEGPALIIPRPGTSQFVTCTDISTAASSSNPTSEQRTKPVWKTELWDAATGDRIKTLATSESWVAGAFSPDGRWFALRNQDVKILDVASGESRVLEVPWEPSQSRTQVAFSADSQMLLAGNSDAHISVWSVGTWELQREFRFAKRELAQLKAIGNGSQFMWHSWGQPDSALFVSDSVSGVTPSSITLPGMWAIGNFCPSPDGAHVLAMNMDPQNPTPGQVFDLQTGQTVWVTKDCWVTDAAFPRADVVALINRDGDAIRFWDLHANQVVASIWIPDPELREGVESNRFYRMAISADAQYVVTSSSIAEKFHFWKLRAAK